MPLKFGEPHGREKEPVASVGSHAAVEDEVLPEMGDPTVRGRGLARKELSTEDLARVVHQEKRRLWRGAKGGILEEADDPGAREYLGDAGVLRGLGCSPKGERISIGAIDRHDAEDPSQRGDAPNHVFVHVVHEFVDSCPRKRERGS